MKVSARTIAAIAAIVVLAAALAGCGSSKTSSATTSNASNAANTSATQSTSAATSAAVISTKTSSIGTILAGGDKKLSVYLFEADSGGKSACSGACAAAWPPVLTTGSPTASGSAKASQLGTITRSDGKTQVTYNGHPLYYYASDGDAGDVYGQGINGFGALWWAMSPSGSAVTKSVKSSSSSSSNASSSSSGSSGYGGY